ncbi:MAG: FAD:protein FMN transferase [Dorea sp.]|jgi:thiamine biosynthesis lipoprotein|nr:FAD:protein FMN transferase [Dorea sp.]
MRFRKTIWLLTAVIIFCTATTAGCSEFSRKPLTYTGVALDTVISIQIYDSRDEELTKHCQQLCEEYEAKFSRTIETSEIAQINAAGGAPVEVSEDTVALIKKGIYYCDLSDGAFDITIGSVTSLWDFKAEDPAPPAPEALAEAVKHVNYRKILINDNTVRLLDPAAKLDLGAIAKGYIADRIKDYLKSEGVRHALINLGGNVLAIGGKLDGSPFNIGIQKPFDEGGSPITSVRIQNKSVVTSGTYQRYFEKNDLLYHHILSSSAGTPCNNGLNSVTIITDSSLTADALSTTCFLLGPEAGMKLINQLDNVDAVFINTDNELSFSRNYSK